VNALSAPAERAGQRGGKKGGPKGARAALRDCPQGGAGAVESEKTDRIVIAEALR